MPQFTKTVSQLVRHELLSAAQAFNLDTTGNVTAIRARVKAHIDANEDLMNNADYHSLFSREQRNRFAALTPNPSTWDGIRSSVASTPAPSTRAGTASGHSRSQYSVTPAPDSEHEANLQYLQNLPPAALSRALGAFLNPGKFIKHNFMLSNLGFLFPSLHRVNVLAKEFFQGFNPLASPSQCVGHFQGISIPSLRRVNALAISRDFNPLASPSQCVGTITFPGILIPSLRRGFPLPSLLHQAGEEFTSPSIPFIPPSQRSNANNGVPRGIPAASTGRKRPARVPGLTVSNASHSIPEAIRKKFSGPDGWKTHVPLQFLTDKYCSSANNASSKELNDIFTMDGSSGSIISVAKELPIAGELSLTFDEWYQAYERLLELIGTYVPDEYEAWFAHYQAILKKPNRAAHWALCLEYDSEIRRRALNLPIDPSVPHLQLWNELEAKHIGLQTLEIVQLGLQGHKDSGRSHNSGKEDTGRSHKARDREHGSSGTRFQPYDKGDSFRSQEKFRCFICGDDDVEHRARQCTATKLVNGKDALIYTKKPGGQRKDRNGEAYCYSFNGRSGCSRGNNCSNGNHWCSLCGAKSGHSAQNCPTI
ncbi:hypothetical protein DFH06DRAFT_1363882 [Mycena polygramma]|nr:hypothetical protein DFH06DRAFT_1363882 [Mycena polygramma]